MTRQQKIIIGILLLAGALSVAYLVKYSWFTGHVTAMPVQTQPLASQPTSPAAAPIVAVEQPLEIPITSEQPVAAKELIDAEQFSFLIPSAGDRTLGYQSLIQETVVDKIAITGTLPGWLSGTLLRVGPAKFELGKKTVKHWFDGFAMVYKFTISNGTLSYANKFLATTYYTDSHAQGTLRGGFAQDQQPSWWSRVSSLVTTPPVYDNANVNVCTLGSEFVALTETPYPVAFDLSTLKTKGDVEFDDELEGHTTTAHPQFDPARNEWVNFITEFGKTSYYKIYSLPTDSTKRRLIASLPVEYPSYMHSFALTPNYIVLTEVPLVVNPFDLLMPSKPFVELFAWKPERGTSFIVVDRATGKQVAKLSAKPFFMFHHVNAFERDGKIVVDIITYPDTTILNDTLLARLRNAGNCDNSAHTLERFTLDLTHKTLTTSCVSNTLIEMPRINPSYALRDYTYVYGLGALNENTPDCLLAKLNVKTGQQLVWQEIGCFPGEGVFVAQPGSTAEDDGVVLSVVLDTLKKKSFLLMLDAQTFKERARAWLPHTVPFGFHGNFYSAV